MLAVSGRYLIFEYWSLGFSNGAYWTCNGALQAILTGLTKLPSQGIIQVIQLLKLQLNQIVRLTETMMCWDPRKHPYTLLRTVRRHVLRCVWGGKISEPRGTELCWSLHACHHV